MDFSRYFFPPTNTEPIMVLISIKTHNFKYFVLFFFFCINFGLNKCIEDSLWEKLQIALRHFDAPYFEASSNDVSTKAKLYLQKDTLSFVISPVWLELLLLAISLGTTGDTLKELDDDIYLDIEKEEKKKMLDLYMRSMSREGQNLHLEVFSMMFVGQDIQVDERFSRFAQETFNMTINTVDFNNITHSRLTLNKMISKRTKRKMKKIFDDSDFAGNSPSLVFINSVYYKNKWLYPPTVLNGTWEFLGAQATEGEEPTRVKMFRVNGEMPYGKIPELKATVVDIPYITPGISMLVFLPDTPTGLLSMEERLLQESDVLQFAQQSLVNTPVAVSLPKFSLDSAVLLPGKLKAMGINKIFSKEAELDAMVDAKNTPITHMVQRIKLWGTEGRGAFKDTGDEEFPKPKEIVFANHPFMFIIKMNDTSFMMGHFLI